MYGTYHHVPYYGVPEWLYYGFPFTIYGAHFEDLVGTRYYFYGLNAVADFLIWFGISLVLITALVRIRIHITRRGTARRITRQ
jgi:hypothetical protein